MTNEKGDSSNIGFVLTVIGLLISITGLMISIIVPFFQARNARLNVSYVSKLYTEDNLPRIEDFDIDYEENTINQLTMTAFLVTNIGNVSIEDTDLYEGHKLKIQLLSDNATVLFAKAGYQTSDINNGQVFYDENSVEVRFDTLEKNDQLLICVYHTGDEKTGISIDGRIKDGKIVITSRADYKRYSNMAVLVSIILLAFSVIGVLCKRRFQEGQSGRRLFYLWFGLELVLMIIIICGLVMFGDHRAIIIG